MPPTHTQRMTIGRCSNEPCGKVWEWPTKRGHELSRMACPECLSLLNRTTRLVQRQVRTLTSEQVVEAIVRADMQVKDIDPMTWLWKRCKQETGYDLDKASALYYARGGV